MTATAEITTGVGRVARVTGPVVDVEFPVEAMPALFNALNVDVSFDQGRWRWRVTHLGARSRPAYWGQHGAHDFDATN